MRPSRSQRIDIDVERSALISSAMLPDLEESTARQQLMEIPGERFASSVLANRGDDPLLQPRGGFASAEKQRALSLALSAAGADFLPLTIDSHSRLNDYETAARLLERSTAEGRDLLNGYPLIAHGVAATRRVFEGIDRPVSLRHGTPDARLLVETALACGITDIEGGALSYTLPYARTFPLDRALLCWQFVDRLCAMVAPADLPIDRESFGPLTATLVPPAIAVAVQLVELLLAAEQGVLCFTLGFGQSGSVEQDVAVASVLRRESARLLDQHGFDDVDVYLAYHQWMGAFPSNQFNADALIAVSAAVAKLIDADKLVVKTRHEALGIPPIEVNADALRRVRYVFRTTGAAGPFGGAVVEAEERLLTSEVRHLIDAVLSLPGVLREQVHEAVRLGFIDVPFSPHAENCSQLVSVRDARRAVRILRPGRMPILADDLRLELEMQGEMTKPVWQQLADSIGVMT